MLNEVYCGEQRVIVSLEGELTVLFWQEKKTVAAGYNLKQGWCRRLLVLHLGS